VVSFHRKIRDIQRDDPSANQHALSWGACFCPACMAGFRDYLKVNATPDQSKFGSRELRFLGSTDHMANSQPGCF